MAVAIGTTLRRMGDMAVLRWLIAGLLVGLGLWLFHHAWAGVRWHEVEAALAAMPVTRVILSFAFTLLGFAALGAYDVLALACVAPGRVPRRLAAATGMVSYAFSNALGFHVLTGGSIRYRIYARAGLELADVGRMVAIAIATLWLGLATLIGAGLLLDPQGVPLLDRLGVTAERLLGLLLAGGVAGIVAWLWTGDRRVSVAGWTVHMPHGRNALAQVAIGTIDVAAAAAALYVLLPGDVTGGFAPFLVVFTVAVVLGMASHAPGGLGVFEATMVLGLQAGGRADVLAALLVFRVVYYFVPLVLAAVGLALLEMRGRWGPLGEKARFVRRVLRPGIPPVVAGSVFLGGVVLLVSGSLPAESARMDMMRDLLPLPFVEASHLFASTVGLLLVVMTRGLARRIAAARRTTLVLLLAGALFSLAKGLDYEEAAILLGFAGLLWLFRDAFYRKGDAGALRPSPGWLLLGLAALAVATWVGFLAYRHVDYADDLWWQWAWNADAPRFLRATLVLSLLALALLADAWINRAQAADEVPATLPAEVPAIVAACPDTQANVALLGDKRILLAEKRDAFVMYGVAGRSWIAMGPPIGAAASAGELIWRFAERADRAGARAVFYQVPMSSVPAFLDLGYSLLKTGEIADVDLTGFTLEGPARQPFRYAHGRAARDGLSFDVLPRERVPAEMEALRAVSDAWLATRHGAEKGFSLGRFEPAYIARFDCAVMRRGGEIVAFANLWRGADRFELSVDLMRYRPDAPRVVMDALFANLMLYGRDEGYRWFNLGAAPLAGLADHPLASTWNRIGTAIYRRGDEWYNFEGLRAFKQKFDPVWSPLYIACPGGLALPRVLLDIATLIAGGPLRLVHR